MGPREHERFGAYRIRRRIAVGGMAEVFEADGPKGRCVLKVPLPQYRRSDFVAQLRHEAALNAALDHPNLVRVHGFEDHPETPFLVMEFVDGVTLAELAPRLTDKEAIHLCRELLVALQHVHLAKGPAGPLHIVHRDVTPDNVLVDGEGQAHLGDFGIARSALSDARTRTGMIKGKLRYLSPEQVTGSEVDARTDLYAVGAILFELLHQRPWLDADTELELLRLAEAPPEPALEPDQPDALQRFFRRTLARFPEARFRDAAQALACLDGLPKADRRQEIGAKVRALRGEDENCRDEHGAEQAGNEERGDLQEKQASPVRRWRGPAIALAMVASIAVAGLVAWSVGLGEASSSPDETPVETMQEVAKADPATVPPTVPPTVEPNETSLAVAPEASPQGLPEASLRLADRMPPRRREEPERPPEIEPTEAEPTVLAERSATEAQEARLAALLSDLGRRGFRAADYPPALRHALAEARTEIRAGQTSAALERAEGEAGGLVVDRDFVQRKLDRTNRAIRDARAERALSEDIDGLAEQALRDFLGGRYDQTNRTLNAILARL